MILFQGGMYNGLRKDKHIRIRCHARTNRTQAKARTDGEYEAQVEVSHYSNLPTVVAFLSILVTLSKSEYVG